MTIFVTKDTGGTAKPVGVLYIEPERQMPAPGPSALAEAGLDADFTADLLSAALAHERCGVHLYRAVSARTTMPDLKAKYEEYLVETTEHVRILEELIAAAGGDPQYVSPSARATEKAAAGLLESTYALAGSIDANTAELAMLEAVMLAESKDHGNWELMAQLAAQMNEGAVRTQMEQATSIVLVQEEEHYGWARQARAEMLFSLATGGATLPTPAADVDLTTMTKDELYEAAQELDITGRSGMTKDELATAVAEHTTEQSGDNR